MGINARQLLGGRNLTVKVLTDEYKGKVTAKIKEVTTKRIGGDNKLVVHFEKIKHSLVLNNENGERLIDAYGEDTDKWKGKTLNIYQDVCEFNGDSDTPCVRIECK